MAKKKSNTKKLNKIARTRAGGDASRMYVPSANKSVTGRDQAQGQKGGTMASKARVRR